MGDSLKILLIDDDELDRNLYKRYLSAFPDLNCSIIEFETGKAGLEYCSQQSPDCILLDFNLPDMDGLEFLSKLENTSIPVLMLTGQGSESIAVGAMKMGVQDYLVKDSITPTHLISSIKNSIRISQLEKQRADAEDALVKANEILELKVKERTASLEVLNKKLVAAKEFAESANRGKSIFFSKMSHELRTPMHAILGFTQLILMDKKNPLADYQLENMNSIAEAGNHLINIINEVLDISKIELNQEDLSIETIDLNSLVNNVISISKPLAEEKGISLSIDLHSNEKFIIKANPLRFKQIVFNLISNAIKYNKPKGSVILSCETRVNGMIRLVVQDTGYGISKEDQEKIFAPFERLNAGSENIEGAGIGLTICKQLIESMDGELCVESVLGEGSHFYVDIPAATMTTVPSNNEIFSKLEVPKWSKGNLNLCF